MRKAISKSLGLKKRSELKTLADLPEKKINTRQTPEIRDWANAKRGVFYRPLKQQLTLRLDADVVAWFREHPGNGVGYQTRINQALREYVKRQGRKTA